jgi:hypothetical protein
MVVSASTRRCAGRARAICDRFAVEHVQAGNDVIASAVNVLRTRRPSVIWRFSDRATRSLPLSGRQPW